jgi:hypothetical protein
MKNISISFCDLYRDGGSIGLSFTAQGGKEYNTSFSEFRKSLSIYGGDYGIIMFKFTNWIRQRQEYELFLGTRSFEESPDLNYHPPVIYLGDCNSKNIVKRLDWSQAKEFIAPLKCNDASSITIFERLLKIIENEGKSLS